MCLCFCVHPLVDVCVSVGCRCCVWMCSGMFSAGMLGIRLVEACFIDVESKAQQMLFCLSAFVCASVCWVLCLDFLYVCPAVSPLSFCLTILHVLLQNGGSSSLNHLYSLKSSVCVFILEVG